MEYLFRRTWTRRSAAYAILVAGIPGPEASPPPNPTAISQPQAARRVTTRHPAYRFFGQKAGGCDEPAIQTTYLPQRLWPERLNAYRRANASINFVGNRVPPDDAGDAPPVSATYPNRATKPRIQSPILLSGLPPPDEPHGIKLTEIPSVARGPRRTSQNSYLISVPVPPPDEPYGVTTSIIPNRAPGPRRSGQGAYFVNAAFETIEDPVITIGISVPNRAPGPRRASASAYSIAVAPQLKDELYGVQIWVIPSRAPGPRRAATTAYTVIQPPPSVEAELLPPNPILISQPQAARRVTTRQSYYRFTSSRGGGCDEPEGITIEYLPTRLWPELLNRYRRVFASIYFLAPLEPPPDLRPAEPPFVPSPQPIPLFSASDVCREPPKLPAITNPRAPTLGSRGECR